MHLVDIANAHIQRFSPIYAMLHLYVLKIIILLLGGRNNAVLDTICPSHFFKHDGDIQCLP